MAQTWSGRAGDAAPEPYAAFLAVAQAKVSQPVRGWHVRLCPGEVLDDQPSWQAEIRQGLVDGLTSETEGIAPRAWGPRPGDAVRAVRVRLSELPPEERERLDLPEDSGAIVAFLVEHKGPLPEHIQDLVEARRREIEARRREQG